jgi:protein ImuB
MHWLAIHLPALSLEALAPTDARAPLAVSDRVAGHPAILLCNEAAAAAGIVPGMRIGAARALSGSLRVRRRDAGREAHLLEGLALWAGRFSSQIVLAPPRGLLLEMQGSKRLFGGTLPLLRQVREGLNEMGHHAILCMAPTPAGALLLAEAGRQKMIRDLPGLHRHLASLSLQQLPLPREQQEALQNMGMMCLGDLLQLPGPGLGRRLGRAFLDQLDRLLGRRPDPRPLFRPPARFHRHLELPAEVESVAALQFAAHRLILQLSGFLTARQAGTLQLEWRLVHPRGEVTRFRLGLLSPERCPERLQTLLQERLERLVLPAPVREIGLTVERLEPLAGRPGVLFDARAGSEPEAGEQLLERLRARLGEQAVTGIRLVPDHRPERAWCHCTPGRQAGMDVVWQLRGERPLWLLPEPVPLEEQEGRPWWHGRLVLEGERERIEAGWWDGAPVARDYFAARTPAGGRLWLYRELRGERRWYLQGFY